MTQTVTRSKGEHNVSVSDGLFCFFFVAVLLTAYSLLASVTVCCSKAAKGLHAQLA